jgi:hypothetical protein
MRVAIYARVSTANNGQDPAMKPLNTSTGRARRFVAERFRQLLELFVALRDYRHSNLDGRTFSRIDILIVCFHSDAAALNDHVMQVFADSVPGMIS